MNEHYVQRAVAEGLCPEAVELVRLAGIDGDVTAAVKSKHGLVAGLTEYLKFVGQEHRNIACSSKTGIVKHPFAAVAKLVRRPTRKKK